MCVCVRAHMCGQVPAEREREPDGFPKPYHVGQLIAPVAYSVMNGVPPPLLQISTTQEPVTLQYVYTISQVVGGDEGGGGIVRRRTGTHTLTS